MIRLHLLALSIALVCGPALAGSGHELKPKHGGWVQEVKDVTFELVVRDGKLVLHLDDHGKPIATQGAPMATSNSPTYGHPNSPGRTGPIMPRMARRSGV